MITTLRRWTFSAGLINFLALSVFACSYADGALFPTKYELIKDSEVIVLAQPMAKDGYVVDFEILEVLKGDFPAKQFRGSEVHNSCVEYSFSVEFKRNLGPVLSQKLPKRSPRYVLFLEKWKGEWTISIDAADLLNEMIVDVGSSAFLRNVKHFIRIGLMNDYEVEKSELKKLRRLASSGRDPKQYPNELIAWIDDHLNYPSPNKSYRDLIHLYSRLSQDEKRNVLWAFAWGKHPEAADFFTTLLKSSIPVRYIGPISKYAEQTKNETLLVRLAKNYPNLDKHARWPIMWALIKTAESEHSDLMLAALRSADKEEAGRLAEWFVRHPAEEAREIVRALVGKEYQENWELSFGLAGMGDEGTIEWAREFMKSPHKDRWMAYYAIAHSPLEEADTLARAVIEGDDAEGLEALIQGYKDSNNPNKWARLRDIVNLDHRKPEVLHWLKRTLGDLAEDGDQVAAELLKALGG
jgi:hypothetical protein